MNKNSAMDAANSLCRIVSENGSCILTTPLYITAWGLSESPVMKVSSNYKSQEEAHKEYRACVAKIACLKMGMDQYQAQSAYLSVLLDDLPISGAIDRSTEIYEKTAS